MPRISEKGGFALGKQPVKVFVLLLLRFVQDKDNVAGTDL
jgi:hypothetical protein